MLPIYEIRKSDLTVKHNNYELSYPEHMHKYIEIVYVYEGCQGIEIEGEAYRLEKGCAAAVFPDTLHSFKSLGQGNSEVLILMCHPKLFGNLFPDLNNFSVSLPKISDTSICEQLKFAFNAISLSDSFDVRFSWACVIMSYILKIINLEHRSSTPVTDITYKIISYIEENFTQDITRDSLAHTFNVSEFYISKIFSKKFKMNLRNYLGLIRTEYAAGLIRTTNETLTTISRMAGFSSIRTFNRMFKATYNMTPKEYKNNINKFLKEEND